MHPILVYILQVNFALVLFYLLFTLLFKRDTFLKIRRFYFLSALLFSVIYPLLVVPGLSDFWNFRFSEPQTVEATVFFEVPTLEVMVEESEAEAASLNIPWEQIFITLYIAVTIFFILRFLWQLISIFRIRIKSEESEVSGVRIYNLKDDITPFSFFGMIFINLKMHSDEELEQIIIHEHTHVKEKHSLDIMLVETILIFSWWNPFVWLLKREMAMNLEYLADNGVLREGVDSRDYQYHLLRLTYHETAVQIVNNFNVSQLKQRIMMMNKTRSSTLKLAKYLLMLPVFFILIAVNSSYAGEKNQNMQEPPPVKKEVTEDIFVVVEEQPEFPGGLDAMMKFLADSIVYPAEAKEKGIQGRVICNFVVMNDGSISDVEIVRGVDPVIDAEAVRVLESMPNWKPGKQRGQAVNVRFTLPVVFRLNAPSDSNDDTSERVESKVIIDELMTDEAALSVSAGIRQTYIFPGGDGEFLRYISQNIRYPVIAQENGIQGLITATLRFRSDGNIGSVHAKPDSGDEAMLSKEVLRVLTSMPNWEKAPSLLVSGKVTDSHSNPLRGASVIIKGTNEGTISDSNGSFQLKVPSKEGSLVISFVGYKTVELALNRLSNLNGETTTEIPIVFRLQGDNIEPYAGPTPDNAVVVVGYGSAKAATNIAPPPPPRRNSSDEIFMVVEEQPEFPGGNEALMKYISDNIKYPADAVSKGIQGRVITNFVVERDGTLTDVQVARGVDPSLDKEAIRLIESMPRWIPGKQRGEVIRVRFALPVVFRLQN